MAGRGYGRGGGRGGFQKYTRPEPFVLYPEDINLPEVKLGEKDTSMKQLIKWDLSFDSYFKAAPYLLDDMELKGRKRMHIERFSDKKKTTFTRDSLSQVLYFDGFVKELVPGVIKGMGFYGSKSKQMPSRKKFRWNPEADAKKLAFFEELEKKFLAQEGKDQKKKKEEESEDEDENGEGNESEDDFNDGDYNQNVDYDDDDDDFNDVEAGNDEDVY